MYVCNVLCFRQNPDKREGRCYMKIEERGGLRRCHQEMGAAVTKATCCCSVGKAWGSRCESCPPADTEEYKTLCPGGTGYRPNPSTVSIIQSNGSQSLLYVLPANGLCIHNRPFQISAEKRAVPENEQKEMNLFLNHYCYRHLAVLIVW